MNSKPHRDTIFLEDAEIVAQTEFPGAQFVTRLHAPRTAARALPGSFAHVTCDQAVPMRRPLSIMRANASDGWIEFLYKVVGSGLGHLAHRHVGESVSVLGPIGNGFSADPERPLALLVGGGVGIPPMVFFAEHMRGTPRERWQPLVLMGSEIPFPFDTRPARQSLDGVPAEATHCMPLLEDFGVPSRLASAAGFEGCYNGYVTDLAAAWLASLTAAERARVCIYACGPTPMLAATAEVARRFDVPAQVSLEEYMACAVGGCAGCTVLVQGPTGPAMKRVCVDGPVFAAASVFP